MSNSTGVFISNKKTNELITNSLSGGAKKKGSKKGSKKSSKKGSKKGSKKSQKGGAHTMNVDMEVLMGRSKKSSKKASKKVSKKASKKASKKGSKKNSRLGRSLPEAIVKGNLFKDYVKQNFDIPSGPILFKFAYKLWNKIKTSNPTYTPQQLLDASKELFQQEKKKGNLEKILEESKAEIEMKKKNKNNK